MASKLVIENEVTRELAKVQYTDLDKFRMMSEEVLFNPDSEFFFPELQDTVVFVAGIDTWNKILDLHEKGIIHIGLRHFNFNLVTSMPYVTLANNIKLVCTYGYINGDPDWSKIELFRDSDFDMEIPRLDNWDIVDLEHVGGAVKKLLSLNPPNEYFGYDYETRGYPFREGFKPLGFSICGSKYGFYVDMRNNTDWQGKDYDFIRSFIEENYTRLVAYNCKFEMEVNEHIWGEKMRLPDAMALLLCEDYRPNRRNVPGLKPCAQRFLGVPSWDDALSFEQKYFGNMVWRYKTPEAYMADMKLNKEVSIDKKITVKMKDALVRIMKETIERYCADKGIDEGTEEYEQTSRRIKKEYQERIMNHWGNEWELSDPYTLGKYCIYDSFYTKLLWDYFKGKYPRAEEIYHNNYHYGEFLEDTAIPINRKRLDVLKHYVEMTKINSGVFNAKFYLKCLEDTVGKFVDTELKLTDYAKLLISDLSWCMSLEPDKVVKELVKFCVPEEAKTVDEKGKLQLSSTSINSIDWNKLKKYTGIDVAREVFNLIKGDSDVASALRRHRNNWIEIGNHYNEISHYQGIILRLNERNIKIAEPFVEKFNKDVEAMVAPYDPKVTKLVCNYFEDDKLKNAPWKCMEDHPEVSRGCYRLVEAIQKEWHDDYWNEKYLGGRDFKKMMGYVLDSDIESWKTAYNFFNAVPTTLLLTLPDDEIITAEEVVNLIKLRELKPTLDLWDSKKIDDTTLPEGITKEYAQWLSNDMIQWASDDKTRTVVYTMLKKYGWLCSAVTQFWNWWWSPDHQKEHDLEVLDYSIRDALEHRNAWYVDFQEYMYGASKQVSKDERAFDVTGFCSRIGFERWEIRSWRYFVIDKDTTMNLVTNEDKLYEDWDNLYKFLHSWEFYNACTKQLSPYLTRMDEDSGKVVGLTRDGCEILRTGVKGDRFITKFNICQVTTKRTSGFFHTMSPNSDELSIVEAPEGKLLTYFDVSQAEPRMMAYMSKDKNFMADYDNGKDVYMELAKQYRPDLPEDELRARYRGRCKSLILALHYGMATETLSHNLDMTLEETEKLQNAYFERYSSAKAFIDRKKKYCKEHGEIETIFGDRIYVSASKFATAGINYVLQNSKHLCCSKTH